MFNITKMRTILEINQLCKYYGANKNLVKAVDHVNLKINQGEFIAIVGKSGSGKSTLLHMLGGLDTPTEGEVLFSGEDIYQMKEDKRAVFRRKKLVLFFKHIIWFQLSMCGKILCYL